MTKTYQGSCHCGRVRFEVDVDLDHVRRCDCSLCHKRGALNHRVEASCFRLLTPLEELSTYQWHTRTATDYFCPVCGVASFYIPRSDPDRVDVNVRCVDGVDPSEISTASFDGRHWEEAMRRGDPR